LHSWTSSWSAPLASRRAEASAILTGRRLAHCLIAFTLRVRRLAGEDGAEDAAQAEHVGTLIDDLAGTTSLLGRHVRRRADHAGWTVLLLGRFGGLRGKQHGHWALGSGITVADASGSKDLREAPVHDLHLAEGAHHDVRRLEIAVNDVAAVGVGQGLSDLLEDAQQLGQAVSWRQVCDHLPILLGKLQTCRHGGPRAEDVGQRPAADQLHGEVEPAVGEPSEVMDGDDGGVLKQAVDARLLLEAPFRLGVSRELRPQHLDRQVAFQRRVAAAVDLAHAAPAKAVEQHVVAQVEHALAAGACPGVPRRGGREVLGEQCRLQLGSQLGKAGRVLLGLKSRVKPSPQVALQQDELQQGAVFVAQLGEAAQVLLDADRLAGLGPPLQVDRHQPDQHLAELRARAGRQEVLQPRRSRLLPGGVEGVEKVIQGGGRVGAHGHAVDVTGIVSALCGAGESSGYHRESRVATVFPHHKRGHDGHVAGSSRFGPAP
jgi:hypothetical protein